MQAGQMDRRIRLLRAGVPVNDGYGERDGDYRKLADVWARFLPGKGSERREMAATEATLPVTWHIRWSNALDDLNPSDRLVELRGGVPHGPEHDIKSVVELGRREGLEIIAAARVDGA